ncbi:MAG: OmpA family protein, partial [Vibrio cyclitrophicus]
YNNGTIQRYSDSIIAISLSPMYRLAIKQEFDVFFKAGPAYIMHDDEDDVVLALGIGAEKQFSDDWALRVEYQYFDDFDDKIIQNLNSNLVTVGLSYNFGTGNTTASAAAAASEAAVTQAPSEPITEPETVVIEEEAAVVVTKAQTESFSQGTFATNSTELSEEGKTAVQPIVEVLQAHPQSTVNIVGHTDSTGAAEYNMMIS